LNVKKKFKLQEYSSPFTPNFKPKFQVFDSKCVENQKPHAENQKPCGKGFEIVASGEIDLPHANGIKPHPNGRFLKARVWTKK
jgi:hypothetical protein